MCSADTSFYGCYGAMLEVKVSDRRSAFFPFFFLFLFLLHFRDAAFTFSLAQHELNRKEILNSILFRFTRIDFQIRLGCASFKNIKIIINGVRPLDFIFLYYFPLKK